MDWFKRLEPAGATNKKAPRITGELLKRIIVSDYSLVNFLTTTSPLN